MQPLELRNATEADYLGSYQREQALSLLYKREYHLSAASEHDTVTTGNLANDEMRERYEHWHVMRTVLKPHVWELF